jgi:hypothetical protein
VAVSVFIIQGIYPSKLPSALASEQWILIWGALVTALLWVLTSMIVGCLLFYRWMIGNAMSNRRQIRYSDITTMLVESATLLSSFAVYFIVAFSVKSPSLVMAPFLLTQIQTSQFRFPISEK